MTDSNQTTANPSAQPETGVDDAPAPAASELEPAPADAAVAIQTWTEPAGSEPLAPISGRTGEPTRTWTIWVASVTSYLATAVIGAATLIVFWRAALTGSIGSDPATGQKVLEYDDTRFANASWLMGQFTTEPGSLGRVLLAVAVTVVALLIGVTTAITGYYAYDGRRWTRWSALVGLALSPLSLLLNPFAWPVMGLTAVAAVAVWLPPSARYFAAWRALRHHEPVFSEPPGQVWYGPLPRYH